MTAPGGDLPTRAQILDFIASADGNPLRFVRRSNRAP